MKPVASVSRLLGRAIAPLEGHGDVRGRLGRGAGRRLRYAAARADPEGPEVEIEAGQQALAAGDHERAASLLAAVWCLPSPPDVLLHQLGRAAAQTGDHAQAERALQAAVERRPDAYWSWAELSAVMVAQGRLTEAEAAMRRALEHDDDGGWFWYRLGDDILRPQGRLQAAGEALLQAAGAGFPTPAGDVALRLGTSPAFAPLRGSVEFVDWLRRYVADPATAPGAKVAGGAILLDIGESGPGAAATHAGFSVLLGQSGEPSISVASGERLAPTVLILGPPKSGTTTLHGILSGHPAVAETARKEISFWDRHEFGDSAADDYLAYFPPISPGQGYVTIDATTTQIFQPELGPRLRSLGGEVHAVLLRRDPVARAYSHLHMHRRQGREIESFETLVEREMAELGERAPLTLEHVIGRVTPAPGNYLLSSCVAPFLAAWGDAIGCDRLAVVDLDALAKNPRATVDWLLEAIGLGPMPDTAEYPRLNVGRYPPISFEIDARLRSWFEPHEAQLDDFLTGVRYLSAET